ncbi:hypothetical protein BO78DRAFT_329737 [Aspergillus sclerotiicarbonarius CBS 121057]|uniref:C2H2-type domain-containing protein n=1 Tax=Aspergillus sclerotiicarbonarius (strain CBS 121057 / IBT 28362) TaxID=1448318 RepID=A0A319DS47_ASPSB|nr:hypothetical protein BO78DRAFT_329737 [Aspergillus sclerotiicarbonarius CBS 121057]
MYECDTCPRYFGSWPACRQHMDDKDHWAVFDCETCDEEFSSEEDADWHMSRYGHYAPKIPCETCERKFHTQHSADQHMDALGHWAPTWPCETCDQMFFSERAAERHMQDMNHYRHYCRDCDRRFQNENNLRMHLNSKIHRGQNITCPFCKTAFTTATGVAHHLERGSCPRAPSLNRKIIYKWIHSRDTQGIITKKMLEWHEDDSGDYSATRRAFNGKDWECYICHRKFNTVTALNQHLNSPVHKQKLYHCPNSTGGCGKEFTTIAALFNHWESESCGFMRFEKVQLQAQKIFDGNRMISV